MKEHVVTLAIKVEEDHPDEWDWPTLLDLPDPDHVKVISVETFDLGEEDD